MTRTYFIAATIGVFLGVVILIVIDFFVSILEKL